ncbi:hypothetical protein [Vibrio diazotrophicus]|uniref:hypothetical protein n=1 Tax=Vibrio diazotrophicus TaxID=685 RepID=UPI0011AEC624|nr:hypothetical protein [Vibrio diazotrophicus]
MRAFFITLGSFLIVSSNVYASDDPACHFLPKSEMPKWVNKGVGDDAFYYGVGGSAAKTSDGYLSINELIKQSRNDAIENLSQSIRSSIKVSTKRIIESQKNGKSPADIRKQVNHQSELVSQTAISAVMEDSRWLDTENCLLWYRVKVSKKGAEFAIQSYVNQVEERLTKRIDDLTKRDIEQILSDNGFGPSTVDATRALLNDSKALYRGQEYSVADLYNKTHFKWLEEQHSEVFFLRPFNRIYPHGTNRLNVPMSIIASGTDKENITRALKKLQSFGIDLDKVNVTIGRQYLISDSPEGESLVLDEKKDVQYKYSNLAPTPRPFMGENELVQASVIIEKPIKVPYVYNFQNAKGFEVFNLIHAAVLEQRIDLLKPLQEIGVSLDQLSKHGYTPLALSIELEDFDLSKELLKLGAKKEANDYIAYKVAFLIRHIHQYVSKETANNLSFDINTLYSMQNELRPPTKLANSIEKQIKAIAQIASQRTTLKDGVMTIENFINGELK